MGRFMLLSNRRDLQRMKRNKDLTQDFLEQSEGDSFKCSSVEIVLEMVYRMVQCLLYHSDS